MFPLIKLSSYGTYSPKIEMFFLHLFAPAYNRSFNIACFIQGTSKFDMYREFMKKLYSNELNS